MLVGAKTIKIKIEYKKFFFKEFIFLNTSSTEGGCDVNWPAKIGSPGVSGFEPFHFGLAKPARPELKFLFFARFLL